MKKTDKIIIGIMLSAITLLEIGYAAMQNVTLNITGTATAEAAETLEKVTNANIGDYIDLGNNIVGTESTSDDWRVLYVEDDTVYAILADYLPASKVPISAGLDTNSTYYPYSVWSDTNTNTDTLLNGLENTTAWSSFANSIIGATVTGSPTAELIMSSYNTKNGTELEYTNYPTLDSSTEDYDLYVPHTELISGCWGYWTSSECASCGEQVDGVFYDGRIGICEAYNSPNSKCFSARPVVELPITTGANLENGIWKIL